VNRREFENRIHRWLLAHGWRVQRDSPGPKGWRPAQAYWNPAYLRRLGFRPGTLVDAGVATGTNELYEAFPDAHLVLVEPVAEFAESIGKILRSRKGVYFPVALGSEPGERTLRIEPYQPLLTSFYERHALEQTGSKPVMRTVKVETLDRLVASTRCPRPFGLKIDVEGAELEVIRGAAQTLRETEFVISEVSVLPRFEGSYRMLDFVSELDVRGFEVCDILDIGRTATSHVAYFDLVFKRKDSTL